MPFYTKKPVTIEAQLFVEKDILHVADWCKGYIDRNDLTAEPYIKIATLEGIMTASVGDYIIKGVKGEFYPCKPDIFFETYSSETDEYEDEYENDEKSIIRVDDLVDHEDGSCTIGLTIDIKSMRLFAEIGILKVLTDESRRIIADNDEFDTNVGC